MSGYFPIIGKQDRRLLAMFLLPVLAAALTACRSGNSGPVTPPDDEPDPPGIAELLAELPAVPADLAPSGGMMDGLDGSEFLLASGGASAVGTSLSLQPAADSIDWAVWALESGSEPVSSLGMQLAAISGGEFLLAVANFHTGSWDPAGMFALGEIELALNDNLNASPQGWVFVALAVAHPTSLSVSRLALQLDASNWIVTEVSNLGPYQARIHDLLSVDGKPLLFTVEVPDSNEEMWIATGESVDGQGTWDYQEFFSGNLAALRDRAMLGGMLAVLYDTGVTDSFHYAYRSADGSWTGRFNFDTKAAQLGMMTGPQLAEVSGQPAICFETFNWNVEPNYAIYYSRASSATGVNPDAWNGQAMVASSDNVLYVHGMVETASGPAILYQSYPDKVLHYVLSGSVDGAASSDWENVISFPQYGAANWPASLHVIDGHPAIMFINETDSELMYVRAASSDGAAVADWPDASSIMPYDPDSTDLELTSVSGKPLVHYYDPVKQTMRFVISSTATGGNPSDWNQVVNGPSDPVVFKAIRAAVIADRLAVAYVDMDGQLQYAVREQ
ncbi:hypothetical protein KDL29_12240 [bacterium]|nr:hypothetical protein [bacterium]